MEAMWSSGSEQRARVVGRLERKLAYTTVMTTLDRLFKKGLLEREMTDRAFVYSSQALARGLGPSAGGRNDGRLPGGPRRSLVEMLLSCLVDAVGTHDAMLLDELEKKIQRKREELAGK